jgi:hypothetical protein
MIELMSSALRKSRVEFQKLLMLAVRVRWLQLDVSLPSQRHASANVARNHVIVQHDLILEMKSARMYVTTPLATVAGCSKHSVLIELKLSWVVGLVYL